MRSLLSRKFLLSAAAIGLLSWLKLDPSVVAAISGIVLAYLSSNVGQKAVTK